MSAAEETLSLALPASSANLGPAFDAAAVAWNCNLRVRAQLADTFAVQATGRERELCGEVRDHLILNVYRSILEREGRAVRPLALELDNEIPVGKGCGSSAAARLAGVALAVHFGRLGWSAQTIAEEAARLEGHADNVAACWWGGFVVVQTQPSGLRWLQVSQEKRWPLLVVVPREALATERARAVLPETYRRADAVSNVQNAMLLACAWQQGRGDLLTAAMRDRMHQPFRAPLCPLLDALSSLAGCNGILGCCLSGAGPAVLLVVADAAAAVPAVQARLSEVRLEAEILEAAVVTEGPGQKWRNG